MADISRLARLLNGKVRGVDLSSNTLVLSSIKIGAGQTELTQTILDNLVTLQNGSDISAALHHHDGRYYTETEMGSTGATSGADLVGTNNTPTNYSAAAATVQDHLEGIDTALAAAGSDEQVKVSANDTTAKYLEDAIVVSDGVNATNILELSTLNDGANEDLQIQIDQSKIDHGSLAGLGDDDHTQYIRVDGTRAFTGDQSMGGSKLTNLGAPTASSDAATKGYVDTALEGLKPKEAVRVATTAAGTLATSFENGDTIDGITLVTGDRILIKDQASASENGIYTVEATGAPTRATDFDSVSPIDEINGSLVAVQEGTDNAGKIFVQQGSVTTIDTDAINFVFYNSNAALVGGDGITVSGSNISIDLDGEGIDFSAGQLVLELDGATLSKSATGVKVADLGVDTAQIAADAVDKTKIAADIAGLGLSQAVGGELDVNVDDSSIEISTDTLQVKALGITNDMLAGSIATTKFVDSAEIAESVTFFGATDISGAEAETLTDGSNADSLHEHGVVVSEMVAGEAMAANTSFLVRRAVNGETAGRVYKADKDASANDRFDVIGIASISTAASAGSTIRVFRLGEMTLGASDTPFNAADIGLPVFLQSTGAFSITAPTTADEAVKQVGIVAETNKIDVQIFNGIVN